MKTVLDEDENVTEATIIINSSKAAEFQRFSLLHELGHLVTKTWTTPSFEEDASTTHYTLSTHIDYDVTNISEKEYRSNSYLLREQIANIFALRVLMPSKQFYQKLRDFNDIEEMADFFGLNKEAVVSRAQIGM